MKKYISISLAAVVGLVLTGCDNLLDDNRYPETDIVNSPLYWNNPDNCDLQVNRFYQYFYGYGSGSGYGNFYFNTLTDDQCGNGFVDWKFTNVPNSSSTYNSMYTVIRGCNYIIDNVEGSSLTPAQKANYIGQARMMRGYEYYQLVRMYGDVILVDKVLDPESPELFGERKPRKEVIDFALADLEYAAKNITLQNGIQKFSKDLAAAILSDMCLYEGTFWKYCTEAENYYAPDPERATRYLNKCVEYSEPLLASYPIGDDYAALYNSVWTASPSAKLTGLSNNPEVIFATQYDETQFKHSTISYITSSTTISGISKDAFDAYLFTDGKPLASTNQKTDANVSKFGPNLDEGATITGTHATNAGYGNKTGGVNLTNLLKLRDKRLSATIDPYLFYKNMTFSRSGSMQMTSSSGYGVKKYDNVNLPVNYRTQNNSNFTCAPLYWGAVIALNFAEAKAELGSLSDADLTKSLNKLYKRAGLPDATVASLSAINDPANNMNVSSLLWEVRRCRRCELIMDNDYRYWDLVRWHQLELLDNTKHPNVLLGANVKNAPVAPENATGDYVNATFDHNRVFDKRQYQYPIPQDQLNLNENLKQNPNWVK